MSIAHTQLAFFQAPQLAQWVKNLPAMQEMQEPNVQSLGWEDILKEGMATHSSILAWKIPQTERPGRLQSMGCKDATEHAGIYSTFVWFGF